MTRKKSIPTYIQTKPTPTTSSNTETFPSTATQLASSTDQALSHKSYAEAILKTKSKTEPMVSIPKKYFMNLITETVKKIAESSDLKQTHAGPFGNHLAT